MTKCALPCSPVQNQERDACGAPGIDGNEAPRVSCRGPRGVARVSLLLRFSHWLAARPWVYDRVQRLAGAGVVRRRLRPRLAETGGRTVLDVGAGTGLYLSCLPPSARYIWLDNDLRKLEGFRSTPPARHALLGDAACLGLRDASVDFATCTNVSHHLDDGQLARCVDELARVVRGKLILHDAVTTARPISRLLWSLDRGSHPRSRDALVAAVQQRFDIEDLEQYSTWHEYLLLVAVPRPSRQATS